MPLRIGPEILDLMIVVDSLHYLQPIHHDHETASLGSAPRRVARDRSDACVACDGSQLCGKVGVAAHVGDEAGMGAGFDDLAMIQDDYLAARSTTEVVDALETRDLAERRPDPGDRRATLVEVTEHGASILDEIRVARGTEAERAFDRLSPTDRAHLARILRKLWD
jgi:hypothetical protein